MTMQFTPAKKYQARLRLALSGPSGSGKTYSALAIGSKLGDRIALIDTEHGSASLYADRFEFDTLGLETYHPQKYIDAINAAAAAGYDVLIIDSLTHAWSGKEGALEQVDKAKTRSQSNNSFVAWKDVTPLQNRLYETILGAPMHIIVTLRSKTEYVIETINGRQVPRKIGMAPIQRDGIEYEFTAFGEMNAEHQLVVTKSRIAELADAIIDKPGAPLAEQLIAWLSGEEPPPPAPKPSPPPQQAQPPAAPSNNGTAPRAATDAQKRAIHVLLGKVDQHGERASHAAFVGIRDRWPEAIGDDQKIHTTPLTTQQASEVIAFLNAELSATQEASAGAGR